MAESGATPGAGKRSGDDLYLLYTGGTTGMPKGVMWRQDDLFALFNRTARVRYPEDGSIDDVIAAVSTLPEQPVRLMPCPPLMHGSAAFTAFSALSSAGSIVLTGRRFSAMQVLDSVERERVTELTIVGDAFAKPLLAALDAEPRRWDLSSLWLIVSSGAMWAAETKSRLVEHLPHLHCVDTLGSSEAVGVAASRSSLKATAQTAGFRLGPETRVLGDDGTGTDVEPGSGRSGVVAFGGRMPLGYYKDPTKTASTFRIIDGRRWSIPGDHATVEADGTIRLLGRGSVCINTGGEKVFPEEVEEVLKMHEAVADAVVVGVPDERFGEAVAAVVEPVPGSAADPGVLIAHVKERLAHYKAPRHVFMVESIGRAENGKVDYKHLRALAESRVQQP